jgi:hypothetical protein
MQTEYYKSKTTSTFSVILAASMVGLSITPDHSSATFVGHTAVIMTQFYSDNDRYYVPAVISQAESEQLEVLRNFAAKVITETKDSPQEVVDLLNKHFWELV